MSSDRLRFLNSLKKAAIDIGSSVMRQYSTAVKTFCYGMGLSCLIFTVLSWWSSSLEIFLSALLAAAFYARPPDFEKFERDLGDFNGNLKTKVKQVISEYPIEEIKSIVPEFLLKFIIDPGEKSLDGDAKLYTTPGALLAIEATEESKVSNEEATPKGPGEANSESGTSIGFPTDDVFTFGFLAVAIAHLSTSVTFLVLRSTVFGFVSNLVLNVTNLALLTVGQITLYVKYYHTFREQMKLKALISGLTIDKPLGGGVGPWEQEEERKSLEKNTKEQIKLE